MNTNRSKPLSLGVLRMLLDASHPMTRSDIAGKSQMTIKRLGPELEILVDEGLVDRVRLGLKVAYKPRRTQPRETRWW